MLTCRKYRSHETLDDLSRCKDTNCRTGSAMICADVWSPLKVLPSPWQSVFFQTTALGSRAGLKSLPQTSTTFYELLLRRPRPVDVLCEAFEVVELIQLLPVEVLIIWARIFLLETQDGVVQDELAFWRIAVVVNKESAFDLLAKIHLKLPHLMRHSSGVATCWGLLTSGSIILRWHSRSKLGFPQATETFAARHVGSCKEKGTPCASAAIFDFLNFQPWDGYSTGKDGKSTITPLFTPTYSIPFQLLRSCGPKDIPALSVPMVCVVRAEGCSPGRAACTALRAKTKRAMKQRRRFPQHIARESGA